MHGGLSQAGISSESSRWFLVPFSVCVEWNCVVHVVDKPQKTPLSFRAVELGLRMAQRGEDVDVIVDGSVRKRAPLGRVHERVAEQTVAVPVPPVKLEIVEVIQTVAVSVEATHRVGGAHQRANRGAHRGFRCGGDSGYPSASVQRRNSWQLCRRFVRLVPQARVQQRIDEHSVEVLVPQITEDTDCTTGAIFGKDL